MLTALLKTLFAGGIITWLVTSGKLDMKLFLKALNSGSAVYISFALIIIGIILTAFRWKIILEAKSSKKLRIRDLFPIHWMGLFFSTFLPGVVTGDIIKLLYVKDLDKNFTKTYLLTSILIDRLIGLSALLLLAGTISIINYNDFVHFGPNIKRLVNFNLLLALGSLIFILSLFAPIKIQKYFEDLISKIPKIGEKISDLFHQTWIFGQSKKRVIQCLLLSVLVHVISIYNFYFITKPFYTVDISLAHIYGVIPIGFISTAIPIAPSGAGVGHVVFDTIFNFFKIEGGASLFNLFFLFQIMMNLLGFFPYILAKKRHSLDEASHYND